MLQVERRMFSSCSEAAAVCGADFRWQTVCYMRTEAEVRKISITVNPGKEDNRIECSSAETTHWDCVWFRTPGLPLTNHVTLCKLFHRALPLVAHLKK